MIKGKENFITSVMTLLKRREIFSNAFENKLFSLPSTKSEQVGKRNQVNQNTQAFTTNIFHQK